VAYNSKIKDQTLDIFYNMEEPQKYYFKVGRCNSVTSIYEAVV
jgi:hypothetical protein